MASAGRCSALAWLWACKDVREGGTLRCLKACLRCLTKIWRRAGFCRGAQCLASLCAECLWLLPQEAHQVCMKALNSLPQVPSNCRQRSRGPSWQEQGWQQGPHQARLPRLHQQLLLMGQRSLPGPHCKHLPQGLLVSLRAFSAIGGHCVPLAAGLRSVEWQLLSRPPMPTGVCSVANQSPACRSCKYSEPAAGLISAAVRGRLPRSLPVHNIC